MNKLPNLKEVMTACAMLVLASCGAFQNPEDAPLPGKRIDVMLLDERVIADPEIAELPVVLPPPRANVDWPQAAGNPRHNNGHLALPGQLNRAWSRNVGAGSSGTSRLLGPPVVQSGRIITIDTNETLHALSAATGEQIWRKSLETGEKNDRLRGGSLAADTQRIYVNTAIGTVFGLDLETGEEIWRRNLSVPLRAPPTVIGDYLLVLSSTNQLIALETSSGSILWQHAGFTEQAAILGGSPPASDGALAIVAYSSGEIFALALETGQFIWNDAVLRPRRTLAIGSINDITAAPVIDDGRVIIAGNGGQIAILDLSTGARIWDLSIASRQTPWVAGDFIYLLTERNEIVALLKNNGRVRWVSPLARLLDPDNTSSRQIFWSQPVLAGDRLILSASTGKAITVSPYNGEILGQIDLPGPASISPVVANNTIFFLTDGGQLIAYR